MRKKAVYVTLGVRWDGTKDIFINDALDSGLQLDQRPLDACTLKGFRQGLLQSTFIY